MEEKRKGFPYSLLSAPGYSPVCPVRSVRSADRLTSGSVHFLFFWVKLENRFENTSRFKKMFKTLKCSNLKLFKFENWSHFKNCSKFKTFKF
jgi:hypothetical protein